MNALVIDAGLILIVLIFLQVIWRNELPAIRWRSRRHQNDSL